MRKRSNWPPKFTTYSALFLALCSSVALTGPARAEPPVVVLDQSPRDFFRPPEQQPKLVFVSVAADGSLSVMGRPVTDAELGRALRRAFTANADTPVYLRADADVRYEAVLQAARKIEAAGFVGRVRILNEDIQ